MSNFYFIGLGNVLTSLLGKSDEYGYKVNFSDLIHYTNGNIICIIVIILIVILVVFFIIGFNIKNRDNDIIS